MNEEQIKAFAEGLAGITWVVVFDSSQDYGEVADKMGAFVERTTDLNDKEMLLFFNRVQALAYEGITREEFETLVVIAYKKGMYERKLHRSQGH